MIRKFERINGKYIEKIYGQTRLAFAMSDNEDLYDLIAWSERGGYQGSILYFYDFETGDVYQPFEKKEMLYTADRSSQTDSTIFCKGIMTRIRLLYIGIIQLIHWNPLW